MEYFDLLDENGNKTGKIKLREQVNKDGDWHRGVFVFMINSKKEILLQKRSAIKESNPNRWTVSASGHLVTGDSSYEAAVRETEEELGIKVKTQKLEYLFTVKEQQRPKEGFLDNEFIDIYWLLMDNDIPNFKIQKEEVAEIRWVSYEEFKKMVKNKDKRLVQHDEIHYQLFQQLEKNCRKKEI